METRINLTTEQKEVMLYTGEAPKKFSYEKSPLKITGTIGAVVDYFKRRWDALTPEEQASTMVKYNKNDYKLELIIDEKHPKQDVITGTISINQDFKAFGVNSDTTLWDVKQFAKFIRLKRSMFPDRAA